MKKEEIFKKNNYAIVRQALSEEIISFVYAYLQNKRTVYNYLKESKFLSPYDDTWGTYSDQQIPNTYSHYSDLVMETLLIRLLPLMQAVTQMDLVPTYSYTRIYKYGDTLHKHIDRKECEISTTLNLGGDPWPIYLQEKGKEEIKVDLKSGDMLVYKGNKLQHWRDPFMGYDCGQVFLHYNNKNGPFKDNNAFDSRPMIGLPKNFKRG